MGRVEGGGEGDSEGMYAVAVMVALSRYRSVAPSSSRWPGPGRTSEKVRTAEMARARVEQLCTVFLDDFKSCFNISFNRCIVACKCSESVDVGRDTNLNSFVLF